MTRASYGARLYGPGGPEGGTPVQLTWREQWLVVGCGEEVVHTLRAFELEASARGFNNSQLALNWTSDAGEYVLIVDDAAAPGFRESAPSALQQRLHTVRAVERRTERRFRWGLAALVLILSLPLLALGLFIGFADPLADWVVRRLPASIEQQIGESVLAQTRAQSSLVEAGPAFEAVQTIGRRLAQPGESPRFYLADRPEINAFAAPGGVVVVFTGLLRAADSPEEVAGVLAHEMAHVELRHSLRQLVKSTGLRVMFAAVLGDYAQLAGWGAQLTELKFSRDAEREADARGLARLVAARIDPQGLPRFFAKLEKQEGSGAVPAVLSTHPATRERLETLAAAIDKLGPVAVEPIPLAWEAARAALPADRK